jgi:hypothetical protein
MKATEANQLRIGNYLQRLDDSIFQVTAQDILTISEWGKNDQLLPKFIPLSEEVLLRCRMKHYVKNRFYATSYGHPVKIRMWAGRFVFLHQVSTDIDYLHQLQNLYFALTGHELELKK